MNESNIKITKKNSYTKKLKVSPGSYEFKIHSEKINGPGIFNVSVNGKVKNFVSQKQSYFNFTFNSEGIINLKIYTNFKGSVLLNRVKVEYLNSKKASSKRIACIIPYSIYGGAEVYLKNIIELSNSDDNFEFIYINKNPLENIVDDIRVNHIKCFHFKNFANTLISKKYDAVIFYNSMIVYQKIISTGVYNHSKIIQIYHSDHKWSDSLPNQKLSYVDLVIKVGDNIGNNIKNYIEIPPIIDLKKFMPSCGNKDYIGTVARFSNEKNLEYILDLALILKDKKFIIYGEGALKNSFILKMREKNIKNIKIESFKIDIYNYYKNFSLFLLPSKIEGLPLTILEALACNVKVIAPRVGAIANLIDMDLVEELTRDPMRDSDLILKNFNKGNNGREYVIKNHSFKSINKKWNILLSNTLISVREKNIIEKTLDFYYA